MSWSKKIWFRILISLMLFLILIITTSCKKSNSEKKEALTVLESQKETIKYLESSCGIFQPEEIIKISPLISGKVIKKPLCNGLPIKKGELLFILVNTEIDLDLKKALEEKKESKDRLDQANKAIISAKIDAKKEIISIENQKLAITIKKEEIKKLKKDILENKKLLELGGIPGSEIEKIEYKLKTLKIELEISQNRIESSLFGITEEEIKKEFKQKKLTKEELKTLRIEKLIENSKNQLNSAKTTLKLANINYKRALERKRNLSIYAITDGFIESIKIERGETAKSGDIIAVLSKNSNLLAKFRIPKKAIQEFQKGNKIKLRLIESNNETKKLNGEIISNSSSINPTTGEIEITSLVKNRNLKIYPGDYFEIDYKSKESDIGWRVPQSAILKKKEKSFIYLVHNKRIQIKETKCRDIEEAQFLISGDFPEKIQFIEFPSEKLIEGEEVQYELKKNNLAYSN